jgi:hypothetical protein
MLVFYDFEVFRYDWLVVLIEPIEDKKTVIVNDKKQLQSFYDNHKEYIWIGFNSRGYDQYILKGILAGFDPYEITDWIIRKGKSGYQFNKQMNYIKLYNYDVSKGKTDYGLKTLECFMGNNIQETSVPFNIDRKLTDSEIAETIKYCTHDVEQTIEVFLERKVEFDCMLALINEFELPLSCIGKTQAQLAAIILGAKRQDFGDEYNLRLPVNLDLGKYKIVGNWFLNSYEKTIAELDGKYEEAKAILKVGVGSKKKLADAKKLIDEYELDYDNCFAKHFNSRNLEINISGVEHTVGWGGIHGAISQYNYTCKHDEILILFDVDQLYPSLMVYYKLLSRAATKPELFKYILDTSLRLKAEKKKKEREPYKRQCNIAYGCEGDPTNNLYDPLHRNLVCIFGQVFLIDLIDKLEDKIPSFKLIQSNTDGIAAKIKRKDFDLFDDVVYEWEQRTHLHMSFDYYKSIFQKDVNNYVIVDYKGGMKSKGGYVKKLDKLDNDLPIVNKAMLEFMVNNTPVENTINECDQLIMFQKVFKLSGNYEYVVHNNNYMTNKCYRVFASKNRSDSYLGKCKSRGATVERFANTPEHCFIENNDINGASVPAHLDKQWYINLTYERLKQFGVL